MFKKILFLGLVIFSNIQPAEANDYWQAKKYLQNAQFYQAIAIFNYLKTSQDYYDRSESLLELAKIYGGIYKNFPLRPNKKKAISYLNIILDPNANTSIAYREEAQKLKDEILNS